MAAAARTYSQRMELVTGATGYVGGRLIERLVGEGRPVRALARDRSQLAHVAGVEAVAGDLVRDTGLEAALDGVETAYYLVHSMAPAAGGANGDFAARDRLAASNFARAAGAAGVERIVYLGGIVPQDARISPHLASRLEVERILLEAAPSSTALRASIIVGARSSSFRILVRLIERLRVLPFPAWRDHRTQPISERDAIEYLARTPSVPDAAGRSLDIAGPEVLAYGEMIERIADVMGVGRMPIRFGLSQTPTAAAVVAGVVGQPVELVRPLMESLKYDLLPRRDARASDVYGIRGHGFDRAVEHALREWERTEELAAR
ncbi:MAG: hypothetical protein QOF65_1205 [Thermoleophilaceae bacterium]|nr:hypothetical protein [Thermoleophilaceae bacterium]